MINNKGLHISCINNINLCDVCRVQAIKNNWDIVLRILKKDK